MDWTLTRADELIRQAIANLPLSSGHCFTHRWKFLGRRVVCRLLGVDEFIGDVAATLRLLGVRGERLAIY